MTRPEWALTAVIAFVLVYAAILVVVFARRRRRFDLEAQREYEAWAALPPEPVDDPCVAEGCGHARGLHYERSDRTRGACRDPECYCAKYQADRPQVLLGVVYDQGANYPEEEA
jgi:hypothetical protein